MKVTVQFTAQLRRVVGTDQMVVETVPNQTLVQLICSLAGTGSDSLKTLLVTEQGTVQPTLLTFLNGAVVRSSQNVTLKEGDILTLMTPISGG
jgi:molybdopterin converting factor small subunit